MPRPENTLHTLVRGGSNGKQARVGAPFTEVRVCSVPRAAWSAISIAEVNIIDTGIATIRGLRATINVISTGLVVSRKTCCGNCSELMRRTPVKGWDRTLPKAKLACR